MATPPTEQTRRARKSGHAGAMAEARRERARDLRLLLPRRCPAVRQRRDSMWDKKEKVVMRLNVCFWWGGRNHK